MLNIILALIIVMIISFILGLKVGIKFRPKIRRAGRKGCKIIEIKSCLGKSDRVIERLNKLN